MNVLAIETSALQGSLALGRDGALVEAVALATARGSAATLAPAIASLLARHSLAPSALDLVVVDVGPGSYTGIRLGLATARGLCFGIRRPLLGIASTAAIAVDPSLPRGLVGVALDAKQGFVYAAVYDTARDGLPAVIRAPFVAPIADAARALAVAPALAGDAAGAIATELRRGFDRTVERPAAERILSLGWLRWRRGERDAESSLIPLYLRPSEAERLWVARQQQRAAAHDHGKG